MHFFRELSGFLFCGEGGGCSGGVKDTGDYGGDRRRHHKADRRAERGKRGDTHHAVTVTGCEQPPETGPRQHGTAGTEASASCGCGAGDEGKAGNLKGGCGTGKRGAGKRGNPRLPPMRRTWSCSPSPLPYHAGLPARSRLPRTPPRPGSWRNRSPPPS